MTDGAPNSYSTETMMLDLFAQSLADAKSTNGTASRTYAYALGDQADVPFMAKIAPAGSEGGSFYFVTANSSESIQSLTTSFQSTVTTAVTQSKLPRIIVLNTDNL